VSEAGAGAASRTDGEAGGVAPAPPEAATSEALARRIAAIALDRKALDVAILDMRSLVAYTDFLVICTGNTERQTKAIQDAIHLGLKQGTAGERLLPGRVEGLPEGRWILMDYLDCIVHIFTPAAREYYRLDTLWGEVPKLEVEEG
jgi:ribosome-associated protein